MRPLLILALLLCNAPLPNAPLHAQALRSLVVPPGAEIAVPPRGQVLPMPAPSGLAVAALAPGGALAAAAPTAVGSGAAAVGATLAAPTAGLGLGFGVLLPLAATAVFGGVLPGSGGSGGAPANTR
jgi:hypothetical protein